MDDNLTNAINKLQSMLSSEDGKKELENMINSFGIGDSGGTNTSPLDGGAFNTESIAKMKNALDTFRNRDDPRSRLLLALKPYLSSSRGARIDTAITLLSLGKIPSIMKIIRG